MGGEKLLSCRNARRFLGSPPRGRGKDQTVTLAAVKVRITPAWAGKSITEAISRGLKEDHPRVGGEKELNGAVMLDEQGSPPRGRGKVLQSALSRLGDRITPAWAGKSGRCLPVNRFHEDHPRVGGEKLFRTNRSFLERGSPPRGRGKVSTPISPVLLMGITPAWAGKSTPPCSIMLSA